MNILKSMMIGSCVVLALLSPSLATSAQPTSSAVPATTFFWGQPASLVPQKNTPQLINNSKVGNLSIGISQTEMFAKNDRATFSLSAPTPAVNRSLSFARIISDSQVDGVWITAVQALAVAENRQVDTEFAYTVPVGKTSKFDSALSYRLIPITDTGKPGLAASLQFNGKF